MKQITKLIFLFAFFPIVCKAQITLGNFGNGDYVLSSDIANIQRLENIPQNMFVKSFTLSIIDDGFTEQQTSQSAFLTTAQKNLICKASAGSRIYISDIKLCNTKHKTQKISSYTENFYVIKDDVVLDTWRDNLLISQHTTQYLLQHPAIYVYPSISSYDTSSIKIVGFKINSIQPSGFFKFEKKSGVFDQEIIHFVKNACYDFYITDILAIRQNRATDTFLFPEIKITANNPPMMYRSKYSFTFKHGIDYFYQEFGNQVDSFYVELQKDNCDSVLFAWHFYGNLFSKDFVKMLRMCNDDIILNFIVFCCTEQRKFSIKLIP